MIDGLNFHPLVEEWFDASFAGPTAPQRDGWMRIAAGADTLIAAPTGSGKTLSAFLWALNRLIERADAGELEDRIHVVYVSPLKALGNDIEKNLQQPLAAIRELARAQGRELPEIRVGVRSGDTPARERLLQVRRPPHVMITTPESLYILLTAAKSRAALRVAETVIVDEIHAIADDKRGQHLALSLERLDTLCGRRLQRIGLSATQRPIETVARFLTGVATDGAAERECAIVDSGHSREIDFSIETADIELGPIATHELRGAALDRIVTLSAENRTTIVFVNTRRLVERIAHELTERVGEGRVAAHHGSLSRDTRLAAEEGLKSGKTPIVVATASLELGIDVGHVDLVCHLGAPRSIATLLQRVGRSGHWHGATPRGVLFPMTRDDLLQCAAAVRAVRAGELDQLRIPENARDILAQQIVATLAAEESPEGLGVEELWTLVRRAYPYRELQRKDFDDVVEMLAEGVSTRRGRRSAHLHFDRVHQRLRPRRGARLTAITGGGAIPDTADYDVVEDSTGLLVGKVNEDFAIESMAGDVFLLGNQSWRIRRVEGGKVRVQDAEGLPPTIPFWLGESPGRSLELSTAVGELRRDVIEGRREPSACIEWLIGECRVDRGGAEQILAYLDDAFRVLGAIPTTDTIVAERFFDESGGMQLVVHAPFGARHNRAFGLALRKRFCVNFDFELQAAATDDGVVISLGEQHSFPLDSVFSMVRSASFEKDLVQAALPSPMFTNRWRWNATRALVLRRHSGGKKVPLPLQRMRADDLLAAVFPAQAACQDNRPGPVEAIDHPLVNETIDDCLHEAMDADGLRRTLEGIESGAIRTVAVETPAPSPLSHELLNANPYAFLDDAPLEERRARAVSLRRVDPDLASGIGALDQAAIDEVRRQAWPELRSADEIHDALVGWILLPCAIAEREGWAPDLEELRAQGRASQVLPEGLPTHWVSAERAAWVRLALAEIRLDPELPEVRQAARCPEDPDDVWVSLARGWMETLGPLTEAALAEYLDLPIARLRTALARLEGDGCLLRGRFSPGVEDGEWCERGLLARVHRLTLGRLRREIEAVEPADFLRFLHRWQHVAPGTRFHGREGLLRIVEQLQGLELPGPAWEQSVLPSRLEGYESNDLDSLCLSGEVAWGRLALVEASDATSRRSPTRAAPLAFARREDLPWLFRSAPPSADWAGLVSPRAAEMIEALASAGASFLPDLARATGRLPVEAEDALWELVAAGLATGDGVAGLRTLLLPEEKRRAHRPRLRLATGGRGGSKRLLPVGRWSLLRANDREDEPSGGSQGDRAARWAEQLLLRWGVVVRELLARERHAPKWRELLSLFRRMEARGEIRGGRFVAGLVGEQFALPEALDTLRAVRRSPSDDEVTVLSAADPLNLVGILSPEAKIPSASSNVLAYRGGVLCEVGPLGTVRSRLARS